jgi:transcriptional regulator with XRE-family HTH domain
VAATVSVEQLGHELRRRRKEIGMSLRDLEDTIGISAATLSRVERGRVPDVGVIEKLAAWLGVNVVAAGERNSEIRTDEDLKTTIAVHLRANKNLSESTARAIAETFAFVMQFEIQRSKDRKEPPS